MFTGIITDIGEIIAIDRHGDDTHLRIRTGYDIPTIALGASIACSGICLSVTETSSMPSPPLAGGSEGGQMHPHDPPLLTSPRKQGEGYCNWFAVMASAETASVTNLNSWQVGTKLNLERALRMGDELGGHIVTGHVDSTARLDVMEQVGESWRLSIALPEALKQYVARKGSIALDGISLTVNDVTETSCRVNIIPHTWQHTTLPYRQVGDALNLEVDLFARYLERIQQTG